MLKNFFKKEEKKEEIEENFSGWDAISDEFSRIYPEQEDPLHYGTLIKWKFGGNDPLDGISIYEGEDYWHFVTYGLTELEEKESDDEEYSGFGMELTFKMKKGYSKNEEKEIKNFCGILQTLARITFENGNLFLPYEYIYTGQKDGMDYEKKSLLTGFITIPDTLANSLETPNGKVEFVQLIAVTDSEILAVHNKKITVKELYKKLGTDITDFGRESVI